MDGVKYAIVYDQTLDDGAILPQQAFFGYDDGVQAVLQDGAQIYDHEDDAYFKLRNAETVGRQYPELTKPYIVGIPL